MTRLEACILERRFAVTAEIVPPLSAAPDKLLAEARLLGPRIDAMNVTDAAASRATMASSAAAAILAAHGLEPVMQLTCRDRNRIALSGDLLGAAAQGIGNLLILTGDDVDRRGEPDAKAVFDLNAVALIELATALSAQGILPSGRSVEPRPHFFVGAADVPRVPDASWSNASLLAKLDAGARFVQTQFCFDPALARAYVGRLREEGITERAGILLGVGPIASARSAAWMNENLGGVQVPDAVTARLEAAQDPAAEGVAICAELIEEFQQIPGVAGVHVMAPGRGAAAIAEVLAATRLTA